MTYAGVEYTGDQARAILEELEAHRRERGQGKRTLTRDQSLRRLHYDLAAIGPQVWLDWTVDEIALWYAERDERLEDRSESIRRMHAKGQNVTAVVPVGEV